jgi:hypothetical protein
MLGKLRLSGRVAFLVGEGAWVCAVLALALGAYCWNREAVFFGGGVYFSDGDCYARMVRVRMIEEYGLRPIRWHGWENFPAGTVPHTTMPLDALIAGLSAALVPFGGRHLELAGAWVSPILGLGMVGFLAVWGAAARLPWRRVMGFAAAGSPILAHGFELGRPDHQSLLVLLVAVALAAEVRIWAKGGAGWGYASAAAWGLALWVSLFEPGILLALVLVARVVVQRVGFAAGPVVVFAVILALAVLFDGWRAAAFHPAFERWALNIGELRSAGLSGVFSWCGWLVAAAPLLLAWRAFRGGGAVCGMFAFMLAVLVALCLWHARWGYFLALAFALSLPWLLPVFRRAWMTALVFTVSLWPVMAEWERMLFPEGEALRARAENLADAVALREAAEFLRDQPAGAVLAPWWFSPATVWWSGKPCVGGTSHQSLPGILASCEFFMGNPDGNAELPEGVVYLLVYDPDRVEQNSAQILGRAAAGETRARALWESNGGVSGFGEIFANRFFKVYRAADAE